MLAVFTACPAVVAGLHPMGSVGIAGLPYGRIKERDISYRPEVRKSGWPSFMIETGLSQSISQLRTDAYYWLASSNGVCKVVLLLSINHQTKVIDMEL